MSDLSEHDRAELERIELELMAQDPRLARLLGGFGRERPPRRRTTPGRRRRTPGRWLYLDVLLLAVLALVPLLVALTH